MSPEICQLRSGQSVGAWLFKANPAVWDVVGALRDGVEIDRWRMVDTYRVGLVEPGQPCALWVTRSPTVEPVAGMYAIGTVVGSPYFDIGDTSDTRWAEEADARDERPYVEIELEVLPAPIPAAALREHPDWGNEEIFRAPRVASPVAVSPTAWSAVS